MITGMEEEKKTENQTGNENKAVAEKPVVRKKKGRKRRIIRRIIWLIVILAILGGIGYLVYTKLRADYKVTYDPYTATTGSMQLINSASYVADGETKVRDIYVAVGDTVREGDKLMRLANGTTFTADFDGTVSVVNVEKGDSVKAEESLLTLADFDHMKVSVRIGESNISEVSVGQPCKVTVSSANVTLDSTIAAIDYST